MKTTSKKSPTAKWFKLMDRELKKHEEKIMKRNGIQSSKF